LRVAGAVLHLTVTGIVGLAAAVAVVAIVAGVVGHNVAVRKAGRKVGQTGTDDGREYFKVNA
jgi:hypothetical protein